MGARGPTDFGDYQIAHMPPLAVCAGAARWAAKYKEYALLRSVFCRTACQHAADKPAHCRAEHGGGSGSYRRVPEPVIARHPRGTWKRQRGETYTRFDAEPFYTAVVIGQGKSKNHWFLAAFLHPFAAAGKRMSRRSAKYPCQRHERNEQRAVGNAGSYAVRHCRAEHGSGSGSYRRVPEPVIARHPRGAWERQRG